MVGGRPVGAGRPFLCASGTARTAWSVSAAGTAAPARTVCARTGQGAADACIGPLARQRALRATGHPYAANGIPRLGSAPDSGLGADVTVLRTPRPATPSRTPWANPRAEFRRARN